MFSSKIHSFWTFLSLSSTPILSVLSHFPLVFSDEKVGHSGGWIAAADRRRWRRRRWKGSFLIFFTLFIPFLSLLSFLTAKITNTSPKLLNLKKWKKRTTFVDLLRLYGFDDWCWFGFVVWVESDFDLLDCVSVPIWLESVFVGSLLLLCWFERGCVVRFWMTIVALSVSVCSTELW
jgi:hypothetical protein